MILSNNINNILIISNNYDTGIRNRTLDELNQKNNQLQQQINKLQQRKDKLKQQTKTKEDNIQKVKELPQHYVALSDKNYTTIGFCTNIDISAVLCFIDFREKVISISKIDERSYIDQKERIHINLMEPLAINIITKQQFDDINKQYLKTMDMVGHLLKQ